MNELPFTSPKIAYLHFIQSLFEGLVDLMALQLLSCCHQTLKEEENQISVN